MLQVLDILRTVRLCQKNTGSYIVNLVQPKERKKVINRLKTRKSETERKLSLSQFENKKKQTKNIEPETQNNLFYELVPIHAFIYTHVHACTHSHTRLRTLTRMHARVVSCHVMLCHVMSCHQWMYKQTERQMGQWLKDEWTNSKFDSVYKNKTKPAVFPFLKSFLPLINLFPIREREREREKERKRERKRERKKERDI